MYFWPMSFWDKVRHWFSEQVIITDQPAASVVLPTKETTPTTMINTITLSSDLSELILIDSGKAFTFSLDTLQGVVLGMMRGQLAVVSGVETFPDTDFTDTPDVPDAETAQEKAGGKNRPVRLELGKKKHYAITFFGGGQTLSVVGITDIDSSLKTAAAAEVKCTAHSFSLQDQTVLIRRIGNALEIVPSNF